MTSIGIGPAETKPEFSELPEYGTHTLPRKFWTKPGAGLLRDEKFQERKRAKSVRHAQNKADRAAENQRRSNAK